jgi:hypothetical protein
MTRFWLFRWAWALASPGGNREKPECGASRRRDEPADFVRPTKTARRSEERAAIEETLRHSGLDPESRIVFSGAKRRKNLIDELDSGLSQQ